MFASDKFFSATNLLNVARQVAYGSILASGYTLLVSSGNIDLSIGSMVGLIGVLVGKSLVAGVPFILCVFLGIFCGMLFGAFNCSICIKWDLPPFIVTMSVGYLYKGAMYLITKMVPVSGFPDAFVFIGQGYLFGIPFPIYLFVFCICLMNIILRRTEFGRHALAVGGNAKAAGVCGININATKLKVYMLMGAHVGLAALVLTARTASAQVSAGTGAEMDSIAAVVLGGTSMQGGRATVFGSMIGCLIVGLINNGLNLLRVDSNWQVVAKGLVILIAIIADAVSNQLSNKRALRELAATLDNDKGIVE